MISPACQKIIQIEITNACIHSCGNCTRFVGHHKKPFFMGANDFADAVDSLKAFPGMIGVMGGEPTIHPKFKELVGILNAKELGECLSPERFGVVKDFGAYREKNISKLTARKGLWTSLGPGYRKHYELIQDTFGFQCINDHDHDGEHLSFLLPYKELGISREDFLRYRNACWVQRDWSASITPKGAFFCEIAAALDMLFDGPGGWVVAPGWWERRPEDFGRQLEWCDMCSGCLPVPKVRARDGIDLMSSNMAAAIECQGGSKKVAEKRVKIFETGTYKPEHYRLNKKPEPYLKGDNQEERVNSLKYLRPEKIGAVIVCKDYADYLAVTLPLNVAQVDRLLVVTNEGNSEVERVAFEAGADLLFSEELTKGGPDVFAKGKGINDGIDLLRTLGFEWILVMDADIMLPFSFKEEINNYALNPGVLYYTRRMGPPTIANLPYFILKLENGEPWAELKRMRSVHTAKMWSKIGNDSECYPYGYFQLFNVNAKALEGRKRLYCENQLTPLIDDSDFGLEVFKNRTCCLPLPYFDVIHLPHGVWKQNWQGRVTPRIEKIRSMTVQEFHKFVPVEYVCHAKCQHGGRLYTQGFKTKEAWAATSPHFTPIYLD